MINYTNTTLESLCIHEVGNTANGTLNLSSKPIELEENILDLLTGFFLKPFKDENFFQLNNPRSELAGMATKIFQDPGSLHLSSVRLAEMLLQRSTNSAIKTGEFFVVYMKDCLLEDELVDAVGLFKSESKDTYLKVFPDNEVFHLESDQGININKVDKGAIIFNTEPENGFLIKMVDRTNSQEAKYWSEGFLDLKAREDNFHYTQNYIQMCRDFALEELETSNKGEQVGLVSDAVNYFKENDHFDRGEFEQQVIREPEIIEAFEGYSKNYESENQLNTVDDFDISPQAVRYSKRSIRSVIKLDKNFHIYVHGKRERIVKGFDEEKGLNYYQVFFEEET